MAEQASGRGGDETAGRPESSQVITLADLSIPETLRAAAEKLRTLAAEAPKTPWAKSNDNEDNLRDADGNRIAASYEDVEMMTGFREWSIAMSPAVAEPLASWLDVEIDRVECGYITDALPHALAFARTILDGQP